MSRIFKEKTKPLPIGTILVGGETYWATSIDGLCISPPLGVTNTLLLSVSDFNQNEIVISPNPATDIINIKGENILNVEIYTLLGKKILINYFNNQVDVSKLNTGIYLLKIQFEKGYISKKIIKK